MALLCCDLPRLPNGLRIRLVSLFVVIILFRCITFFLVFLVRPILILFFYLLFLHLFFLLAFFLVFLRSCSYQSSFSSLLLSIFHLLLVFLPANWIEHNHNIFDSVASMCVCVCVCVRMRVCVCMYVAHDFTTSFTLPQNVAHECCCRYRLLTLFGSSVDFNFLDGKYIVGRVWS